MILPLHYLTKSSLYYTTKPHYFILHCTNVFTIITSHDYEQLKVRPTATYMQQHDLSCLDKSKCKVWPFMFIQAIINKEQTRLNEHEGAVSFISILRFCSIASTSNVIVIVITFLFVRFCIAVPDGYCVSLIVYTLHLL